MAVSDGGFVTMLNRRLYSGWDTLPEAISTNRPTTWNPDKQASLFEGADPAMMQTFWQAMHSLSTFTARALGEAVNFTPFRKLLDVGGGSGAFDIELCLRYPELSATVYDLPFVTDIAHERINEARLGNRVSTHAGDFFADPAYPPGHDVILLSMIMHDWGAVGLVFAQRRPELIERLVVINTVTFLPGYSWHRTAKIWRTPLLLIPIPAMLRARSEMEP